MTCDVCLVPYDAVCVRCGGPACRTCDRCNGCRRLVCGDCDSRPGERFSFAGDRYQHPHNARPVLLRPV